MSGFNTPSLGWKKNVTIGVLVLGLIMSLILMGSIVETLNADEVMVIQRPMGALDWYVTPGIKIQWFGRPTHYLKRDIYPFEQEIRFNDGGHATIKGSIQFEMPLDVENLTNIHTRFGSPEAVKKQLVETIVNKSIYMSGPLMSSRESYAEKRNDLIFYIQDQVENGVYNTTQREETALDELSGEERTVVIVEIDIDEDTGQFRRQEEAFLTPFGIIPFNLAIESMPYEQAVENQIQRQQQLAMDVQEAIVAARKAEQRTITVEEEGKANAAESKWAQEVVKAKEVTLAQQKLEVAELAAAEAEQYRIMKLRQAEGDAEYKRQVMQADGALQPKLDTYLAGQRIMWENIAKYPGQWVPAIMMGSNVGEGAAPNGAQAFIDLLTTRAARDLSLDLTMQGQTAQ